MQFAVLKTKWKGKQHSTNDQVNDVHATGPAEKDYHATHQTLDGWEEEGKMRKEDTIFTDTNQPNTIYINDITDTNNE